MSFLIGEKIVLRPLTRSDLTGSYSEWINSQEADIFTEHAQLPHSFEDLEAYYLSRNSEKCLWLAIIDAHSGKHVGNIEISGIDWVHRKGHYAIIIGDSEAQGRGFAKEASHLILNHAFRKLNLNRIELGVHEDNSGALALYRKLGFNEEGRLRQAILRNGVYRDIIIMSLLASEFLLTSAQSVKKQ